MEDIVLAMPASRFEQVGSHLAAAGWKTSWLHINVKKLLQSSNLVYCLVPFIILSRPSSKQPFRPSKTLSCLWSVKFNTCAISALLYISFLYLLLLLFLLLLFRFIAFAQVVLNAEIFFLDKLQLVAKGQEYALHV